MANLEIAAQVATIFSAIATAAKYSLTYAEALKRQDPEKIRAQAARLVNTYSDRELESLKDRIQACRDRFADEGDGKQRTRCMCSVYRDVLDGNGQNFPLPEWEEDYGILCV